MCSTKCGTLSTLSFAVRSLALLAQWQSEEKRISTGGAPTTWLRGEHRELQSTTSCRAAEREVKNEWGWPRILFMIGSNCWLNMCVPLNIANSRSIFKQLILAVRKPRHLYNCCLYHVLHHTAHKRLLPTYWSACLSINMDSQAASKL